MNTCRWIVMAGCCVLLVGCNGGDEQPATPEAPGSAVEGTTPAVGDVVGDVTGQAEAVVEEASGDEEPDAEAEPEGETAQSEAESPAESASDEAEADADADAREDTDREESATGEVAAAAALGAATAMAAILNLPWIFSWSWEGIVGSSPIGDPGLGLSKLASFEIGQTDFALLAVALYLPVLAALLLARAWRLTWAVRAGLLVVSFGALAVLGDRLTVGPRYELDTHGALRYRDAPDTWGRERS